MRKLLMLLTLFVTAFAFAQGSNEDITIAQALAEDEDFSMLVSLLDQAGLTETLNQTGPYTVFAPANDVFEGVGEDILAQLSADPELLQQVLLSHVVEGAYSLNDFQDADNTAFTSVQGESLILENTAGGFTVNGAGFDSTNVENVYANGMIHGVDSIVFPASMMEQYRTNE